MVIVDGSAGDVLVQPSKEDLEAYRAKAKAYADDKAALETYRGKKTITADGETKLLVANIGNPDDANAAAEHDAEGIGLFRSEFLFMDAKELPSEDEQFALLATDGMLVKRPLLVGENFALTGFKEEEWVEKLL